MVQAQIPTSEKQYLLEFHKSTIGDQWQNKWDIKADPSTWYGVEIEDGHVTALKLYRNNLTGAIPKGISVLSHLQTLNLAFNVIEGGLPEDTFQLEKLTSMRLEMNKLTGNLPQDYSKMTQLEEMSMFNNLLQGTIPKGIGEMSNLKTLNLSSNYLEGSLPQSIEKLAKLERLELFGNKLAGAIEVDLGRLVNLKELILSYNQFEGDLPTGMATLSNLEFVQLQGNDFRSLNSLLRMQSSKLAVFDSDDEFLNMKFGSTEASRTRIVDNKYEDVKRN
jgi:Leucine-rich repeat (LRR) protein